MMQNTKMDELAQSWTKAKAEEAAAMAKRREIEDAIVAIAEIPADMSGTTSMATTEYVVRVVGRIDHKVDGDKVQELAAEFGLTEHLASLFRWKPEINMSAWKNAADNITRPLSGAITAKPGRPSFTVTRKEK